MSVCFSMGTATAQHDLEKNILAIIEVLQLHLGAKAGALTSKLRDDALHSLLQFERVFVERMTAYETFTKLNHYACWARDKLTLNKEQREKTKLLLDALEPGKLPDVSTLDEKFRNALFDKYGKEGVLL